MQNLKKLKGDASHRKFFRKKSNYGNSIVIQAKKDKFKNLLVYDAISKILNCLLYTSPSPRDRG